MQTESKQRGRKSSKNYLSHECTKQDAIDAIKEDIQEIKIDVKSLLKFKWQIIGGSVIVSSILAIVTGAIFK